MEIYLSKTKYKKLKENEAKQVAISLNEDEAKDLKILKNIMTELGKAIIKKDIKEMGKLFQEAGKVYGKHAATYNYCLIPDPTTDIGLAYLHPTGERTPEEGYDLMLIAVKNTNAILDGYAEKKKMLATGEGMIPFEKYKKQIEKKLQATEEYKRSKETTRKRSK